MRAAVNLTYTPCPTSKHAHALTHVSYQSLSLLLHGAQQLGELFQGLSCESKTVKCLHLTFIRFSGLGQRRAPSAGRALLLTDADLVVGLRIPDTLELELLQRLRESLHGDRKTLGESTDAGRDSVSQRKKIGYSQAHESKQRWILHKTTQQADYLVVGKSTHPASKPTSVKQCENLWHCRTALLSFTHPRVIRAPALLMEHLHNRAVFFVWEEGKRINTSFGSSS